MKKASFAFYGLLALFILTGCGSSVDEETITDNEALTSSEEPTTDSSTNEGDDEKDSASDVKSVSENTSPQTNEQSETDALAAFTSEQIEYARVWVQLGPNPDVDGLYVQFIPAGTPLNPDEEISLTYPEDVIQLSGSRLVDGSITYSGNGDGSINMYNVPIRWYGGMPRPEDLTDEDLLKEMEEIIHDTKLEYIEPTDGEEISTLIDKLHINE